LPAQSFGTPAMDTHRLYEPLTESDLYPLRDIALAEHAAFFVRNPHLEHAYADRLIGICLCQGAASHYLDPSIGVKDFDIWFFYREDPGARIPHRARKRVPDGPKGRPIDFLRRAIPATVAERYADNPGGAIMAYLLQRDTKTKRALLQKAVIGLAPDALFGRILWRGTVDHAASGG